MSLVKVVKGLECCTNWKSLKDCYECPYFRPVERCNGRLMQDALAVIDELQAQIENLKKENKYLRERLAEEMEHREDMEGKDGL